MIFYEDFCFFFKKKIVIYEFYEHKMTFQLAKPITSNMEISNLDDEQSGSFSNVSHLFVVPSIRFENIESPSLLLNELIKNNNKLFINLILNNKARLFL